MPRRPRILQSNAYYHVISRSVNQVRVFREPQDFSHFRTLVKRAKQQFPLRLLHYAFMHTHFHFIVQAPQPTHLAPHVRFIKWYYTQWMRKKYAWRGPLWRERYRSLVIEDEQYLSACGLYVELNPVRAGICREPTEYPYSSARKYFEGTPDDLLDEYEPIPVSDSLVIAARHPLIADAVFTQPGMLSAALDTPLASEHSACP